MSKKSKKSIFSYQKASSALGSIFEGAQYMKDELDRLHLLLCKLQMEIVAIQMNDDLFSTLPSSVIEILNKIDEIKIYGEE